jgi:hypothetical protein
LRLQLTQHQAGAACVVAEETMLGMQQLAVPVAACMHLLLLAADPSHVLLLMVTELND